MHRWAQHRSAAWRQIFPGPCAGLVVGTRKRAPPGTMLELNGGYDESPAEDSDGPAAGRRQRAQNRAGACLVLNVGSGLPSVCPGSSIWTSINPQPAYMRSELCRAAVCAGFVTCAW